jgi:hypothetical protein
MDAELRAKLRALMAAGTLPSTPHLIERAAAVAQKGKVRMIHDSPQPEPCTICEEPGPHIFYFWPGGVAVRVHASCNALWRRSDSRPRLTRRA